MIFHARIKYERIPAEPMQIVDHAPLDGLVSTATIDVPLVRRGGMKIGVMQRDDGSACDQAGVPKSMEQCHLRSVVVTVEENHIQGGVADVKGFNLCRVPHYHGVVRRDGCEVVLIDRVDSPFGSYRLTEIPRRIAVKAADLQNAPKSHDPDDGKQQQGLVILDRPDDARASLPALGC
jgi:hypothetical protein